VNTTRKLFIALMIVTMLTVTVGAANAQALNGGCGQIHTIQRGENLFRISLRYGKTVAQLKEFNGIANASLIYAGQQLCIPPVNNPPPVSKSYVVQYGDTLGRIAPTYGVDLNVLARTNNIVNVNRIFAGQTLTIPDFTTQ
jgi:LysM repeat protein